jgi:ABC-type Fe3+/spermidine/putrescine transport system ATPase subunit
MSFFNLQNIQKRYKDQTPVLDDVTLSLGKGELLGLIGESGSGKSTLLRIAAGLETQDKGEVTLGSLTVLSPAQKLVAGYDQIQLVHQQFKLYPHSTVEENIRRPLLLYDRAYAAERANHLLALFGLAELKNRLPRELSGGQQQKVAIARALSLEPDVLLFDEPFSQLDPPQKRRLLEEIQEALRQLEVTGIWVTHDLSDALMLTSSLAVLHHGKIIQRGSAEELFHSPTNRHVAELFSSLNLLPDSPNRYVRPSSIQVLPTGGGLIGHVTQVRFLPEYNLLTVAINETAIVWQVMDPSRNFKADQAVTLKYDQSSVLRLPD